MFKIIGVAATAAVALTAIDAAPAAAQANRTFVSGQGSDSNPCSLAAPCRSFAQALTQTNPGGEIAVLDTAGYGQVTIDRAVSIVNQDGVEAGVTATTGDGITVAAGASDVVTLRGLTVVGLGGTSGITYVSGRSLRIDKCEIRGFTAGGISVATAAGTNAKLIVTDTTVANNFEGVFVGGGGASLTLSRLHATGNGNAGMVLSPTTGSTLAYVVDSLFDNNAFGITATASGGGSGGIFAILVINNSSFSSTASVAADLTATGAGAIFTIGRSQFEGIGFGSSSGGGKLQSYGNNQGFGLMGAPSVF